MKAPTPWPILILYGVVVPILGGFLTYDGLRRLAHVQALRSDGVVTLASVIDVESTIDANNSETTEAIVAFMVDHDPWPKMQTVRFMISDEGLRQIAGDRLEIIYLPEEPTVVDVKATFPTFVGRDRLMVGFGGSMLLCWVGCVFWYVRTRAHRRRADSDGAV